MDWEPLRMLARGLVAAALLQVRHLSTHPATTRLVATYNESLLGIVAYLAQAALLLGTALWVAWGLRRHVAWWLSATCATVAILLDPWAVVLLLCAVSGLEARRPFRQGIVTVGLLLLASLGWYWTSLGASVAWPPITWGRDWNGAKAVLATVGLLGAATLPFLAGGAVCWAGHRGVRALAERKAPAPGTQTA